MDLDPVSDPGQTSDSSLETPTGTDTLCHKNVAAYGFKKFKGTRTRDFWRLVFSMYLLPLSIGVYAFKHFYIF